MAGDDVQMAEGGPHEILPVYQPSTKSSFNAYKVSVPCRFQGIAGLAGVHIQLLEGSDFFFAVWRSGLLLHGNE